MQIQRNAGNERRDAAPEHADARPLEGGEESVHKTTVSATEAS